MAKKRKFNKIRLLETSAVGIPAYPYAHLSAELFSFTKALKNASDKLNEGDEVMTVDEQTSDEVTEAPETTEAPEKEAEEETKDAEVSTEAEVTQEEDEEADEEEADEDVLNSEKLANIFAKGLEKALDKAFNERGLVQKDEPKVDKSLGEMAMDCGFFNVN